MRPVRLTLKNFRSFKTQREFDFADLGIFAIVGDTGVGKTSLLEAITYALFNRSTWDARQVKELTARGEKTMTVVLTFLVEGDEFTVTRISGKRQSIHRVECKARGIDESNEEPVNRAICKALHMDADTFLHTVLLPQGRHADLLTARASTKDDILAELFRLRDLDAVAERVHRQHLRAQTLLDSKRAERAPLGENPLQAVVTAEQAIASIGERTAAAKAALTEVAKLDGASAEQRGQLREYEQRKTALATADALIAELRRLDGVAAQQERALEAARLAHAKAAEAKAQADAEGAALRENGNDSATLRGVERALTDLQREAAQREQSNERIASCRSQLAEQAKAHGDAKRKDEAAQKSRGGLLEEIAAAEALVLQKKSASQKIEAGIEAWDAASQTHDEAAADVVRRAAEIATLAGSIVQLNEALETARQAAHAAQFELEKMSLDNQVAAISGHLHAGDDCPVCHRALPKTFRPVVNTGIEKARKKATSAQKTLEKRQDEVTRLDASIGMKRTELATRKGQLKKAAASFKKTTDALIAHLPDPNDAPLKVLKTFARDIERNEERLRTAREELSGVEAAIAMLGREEASSSTSISSLTRDIETHAKAHKNHDDACKKLTASLPAAYRVKDVPSAAKAMLGTVLKVLAIAGAVESRRVAAAEESATCAQRLRECEDAVRRLVGEPRIQVFERLGAIGRLVQHPALPQDDRRRTAWADSVVTVAKSDTAKASKAIAAAQKRLAELATTRQSIVEHVGGDPQTVVHRLELEGKEAAHMLNSARTTAEKAAALDTKIAHVTEIQQGLAGVREALRRDGFRAYATDQRQHRLIQEASRILLEMTRGRFGFTPDFDIFDTESNDKGSTKTLSGGEKFMASLALSLAAVEVASNSGSKIESLFLDEGFDGLDNTQALELAMMQLRRAAHAGRMICVISHVTEVTKFVDDTIVVTRTADGSEFARRRAMADDDTAIEGLLSRLKVGNKLVEL